MFRNARSRVLLAAAALGLVLAPSAAMAACQPEAPSTPAPTSSNAPVIPRGERETRPTPNVVTPPPATSTAPVIPRGSRPVADPPVVVTPAPFCN